MTRDRVYEADLDDRPQCGPPQWWLGESPPCACWSERGYDIPNALYGISDYGWEERRCRTCGYRWQVMVEG